jgi:DNA-directed RNA polymerase specialized sigma24 family protein
MAKRWTPTPDDFERLLNWLDPSDRERAGEKYEFIRQTLIQTFVWRGCHKAEELADETINRVMQKLPLIIETYKNDPALYFYGFGRNVLKEYYREVPSHALLDETARSKFSDGGEEAERRERVFACLDECLDKLSESNRALILRYYEAQGMAKVDFRSDLAEEQGIAKNALRVRVHRIRTHLHGCISACLKFSDGDETTEPEIHKG